MAHLPGDLVVSGKYQCQAVCMLIRSWSTEVTTPSYTVCLTETWLGAVALDMLH